jgi:mannan endo-1,4-beta-mannosidase
MNLQNTFRPLFLLSAMILIAGCGGGFSNFITVDKDKLKDGKEEFRFVSYNIPNLHYIEDYMKFDVADPWRLPDEFEIRDGLRAIKQSGGKVTRIYTPSVRKKGESETIIRHVLGPGKFNDEAFKALDKVMQIANEEGIRIIFPLLDNWWWWGGPKEYAGFRGKEAKEFWTDSLLISDFKKTVNYIVNRKNFYTGVTYKDDKALLGWETGNELQCPYSWCAEIAKYIKSIDKNHLVIQNSAVSTLPQDQISDPNIDVVSTHYYSKGEVAIKFIKQNKALSKGKKPYYVGEFGFQTTPEIAAVIDTVIKDSVSGIMLWSMRTHNRDGGFYYHSADHGGTVYRWPGFESGKFFDEQKVENLVREKSYQINNAPVPLLSAPESPKLLPIDNPYKISWQGSTGASSYSIERKESGGTDWVMIKPDITDAVWGYKPQFSDTTVAEGRSYSYRIKARNEAGESDWSDESGPVYVKYRMMIDEMENYGKIFKKDGNLGFLSGEEIVQAKEDRNRLKGKKGSFIIYRIPGEIKSFTVDLFLTSGTDGIELSASANDSIYNPVAASKEIFVPEKNEYKIFTAARIGCGELSGGYRFIKILFDEEAEICRIEARYDEKKFK